MMVGPRRKLIGVLMGIKKIDTERKWFSVVQAAKYMGVSKESIYRRLKKKTIPSHRIGKLHVFDREELDAWIKDDKKEI